MPVVLVSGFDFREVMAGRTATLQKPFTIEELEEAIRTPDRRVDPSSATEEDGS
jgi:DNA-binding response OmpR family regulator